MINETDIEAFEYYNAPPEYLVIGTQGCIFCDKAKLLLSDLGITFDYQNYHQLSKADREALEGEAGRKFKTVPQIFQYHPDGSKEYIGGYQELLTSLL